MPPLIRSFNQNITDNIANNIAIRIKVHFLFCISISYALPLVMHFQTQIAIYKLEILVDGHVISMYKRYLSSSSPKTTRAASMRLYTMIVGLSSSHLRVPCHRLTKSNCVRHLIRHLILCQSVLGYCIV